MIPSFFIFQILQNILLSALVCGLAYLLLKRFLPKEAAAIALALGFLTGFFVISGLGGYAFPPKTVQNWLPYVAVAALALGVLERVYYSQILLRWFLRLLFLELFLWRMFQPFIKHPFPSRSWTSTQTTLNLVGTGLLIAIFWWGLDYLLKREQTSEASPSRARGILPTGLMLIGAGSSLSVVLAHSLIMGQVSASLTATLGALAVLAWIGKTATLDTATSPLICLLLTLPWLSIYTTLPLITVVLLALAPLALIPLAKTRSLMQQITLRLGLLALPVIAALLTSWQLS